MFKKDSAAKKPIEQSAAVEQQVPKYERPKILLIDTGEKSVNALTGEGYNVSSGTFGVPYKVAKSADYHPVIFKASLPNYTEQEIVIVDVRADPPTESPATEKFTPMEELDWWAKCNSGVIDPRPRSMVMVQNKFARILENGGVFIIFADRQDDQELVLAQHFGRYDGLSIDRKIPYNNWSFLPILSNLTINGDHGEEIQLSEVDLPLAKLLADHLKDGSFGCTLEPSWRMNDQWVVLAKNKYGAPVAGMILPQMGARSGWIFIFPRISRRAEFLTAFFKNILPDLCPSLFPHAQGQNWVHRKEYELQTILEKARQISEVQSEAARKIAALEKAICLEREANKYLYDLIQETGTNLVEAVKKALNTLGFVSVVDVDAEAKKTGKAKSLREDLRIHDISPTLVIDVKGVAGRPADPDALQAQKHAFIYIKEQNRADVRGLSIINHQRLLPPFDRDNEMPFRQEILDNAAQLSLGLITTWDLFRLTRGLLKNGWKPEHVQPLFYRTGRIQPIPVHYEYVGKIKQVWKSAFSILVEAAELKVGERLAIEFPVDFEEQIIETLHLNDVVVSAAGIGGEVGTARNEQASKVKQGFRVYRLKNS